MHKKVVLGIVKIREEHECGVPFSVIADYNDFGYTPRTPGPFVGNLVFRFCPWCGKTRDDTQERRTVEMIHDVPATIVRPRSESGEDERSEGSFDR